MPELLRAAIYHFTFFSIYYEYDYDYYVVTNYGMTKNVYGSIDRVSACGAEGLGFDSYWA